MSDHFRRLAERTAHAVGSPWAFLLAFSTTVIWGVTGPYSRFSDTWQLIITFLMAFLVRNTQTSEPRAVAVRISVATHRHEDPSILSQKVLQAVLDGLR